MTVVERREFALADLLDRLLGGGAVVTGDVALCVAGGDLVRVDLNALTGSATPRARRPSEPAEPAEPAEPVEAVGAVGAAEEGPP
ncbi:gas vesicle protein GvpJ [Streptomyces sp. NPDC046985]|uniref:gas vesicle protein GvpJ n=1 Tax=Streptomyces sp. NPDC046985 TaxID=3155377 RepID=UPI0033ED6DA5